MRWKAGLSRAAIALFASGTIVVAVQGVGPLMAADISVREVADTLFRARAGERVDLGGRSLEGLDLAGLDFKGARLVGADLFGTDLTRTRLAGANLDGVRLDRAIVIRADFTGASLRGAMLRSLTVFSTVDPEPADAPRFAGADLSNVHIVARLDGTDFRGANLTDARIGQQAGVWGSYAPRMTLIGADFSASELRRTNLKSSVLHFARFINATIIDSDFRDTDLSGADFTGAELQGTDFTGANLDGAIFRGAKGFDRAIGLSTAINADRMIR